MSKTDQQGFAIYAELTDSYGAEVIVKQSSGAARDYCWIFTKGGQTAREGADREVNDGAAHLDTEQATAVRDALNEFLSEHGEPIPATGLKEAIDFLYACKAAAEHGGTWNEDGIPWHWATNALLLGISAREQKSIKDVVEELHARATVADAEASSEEVADDVAG